MKDLGACLPVVVFAVVFLALYSTVRCFLLLPMFVICKLSSLSDPLFIQALADIGATEGVATACQVPGVGSGK
jgi:hypothetical protein